MELDDFKQQLQRIPEDTVRHSADELEGYAGWQTRSVTSNIKRSILFELLACFLFIAAAVWIWIRYQAVYARACSMLSIFLCVFLLLYLGNLYKKINRFEQTAPAVKNSLQQIIDILEHFIRSYFQFTMITLPIAFIFGLITGFITVKGDSLIKNFNWQRALLFYTGWFIFWSALVYLFSKWYIKKLYGNYLQQLRKQLKDIENG